MESTETIVKDILVGDLVSLRSRNKSSKKTCAIVLELIDPDDFRHKELAGNTVWLNYAYKIHSNGKILYISAGQIDCVLSSAKNESL